MADKLRKRIYVHNENVTLHDYKNNTQCAMRNSYYGLLSSIPLQSVLLSRLSADLDDDDSSC